MASLTPVARPSSTRIRSTWAPVTTVPPCSSMTARSALATLPAPPTGTPSRAMRESSRGKNPPVPGTFSMEIACRKDLNRTLTCSLSKFLSTASYSDRGM